MWVIGIVLTMPIRIAIVAVTILMISMEIPIWGNAALIVLMDTAFNVIFHKLMLSTVTTIVASLVSVILSVRLSEISCIYLGNACPIIESEITIIDSEIIIYDFLFIFIYARLNFCYY